MVTHPMVARFKLKPVELAEAQLFDPSTREPITCSFSISIMKIASER
jgi:hypothetical protein